eukprot:1423196-Pyramimonas_sp.AAC.2
MRADPSIALEALEVLRRGVDPSPRTRNLAVNRSVPGERQRISILAPLLGEGMRERSRACGGSFAPP